MATLEFALVSLLGFLPLALGLLQITLLLIASHVLQLAGFAAVRVGANAGGDRSLMLEELARGLAPLYVESAGDGHVTAPALYEAWLRVRARQTALGGFRVLNPTREEFAQFGILRNGHRVIPNEAIEFQPVPVQQANVLAIEVTHCLPLVVPLVDHLLTGLLQTLDADSLHQRCYAALGVPLHAEAHLPMQSDAREDLMH